ncbi:OmpA family protein [Sphingomonas sp.]|uniref:OmpA family protein n=1 Tax=Sphingomonas sp. TaxID=28214 RepID=UPI0018326297|nr:OmpA family protein [Sphingomonas sp.]MBA3511874.1 OmpA family protein [Sphingomonas sp.]
MKPVLLVVILALAIAACDGPSEPASTAAETTAERDPDFARMATAGKMLSDLQTYLASGEPAPRTFTFDRLNFDPGSSEVRITDQPSIHTLALSLRKNPDVRVRIVGFGDGERIRTNNNSLGMERATAIVLALRNAGVEPSRLEAEAGREAHRGRAAQLIVLQK